MKLVNPDNKRKFDVIVVGTGLAGAAAAATLGELGLQREGASPSTTRPAGPTPSPPRAASTPPRTTRTTATRSTASSTTPSRAATSAPARPTSTAWPRCRVNIIDQCVAQGVPFAREYGGLLDNRSFGGAQVSRTFYARGQTGQQLLLGAYQALDAPGRTLGTVELHNRTRDARPRRRRTAGPAASSPATCITGEIEPPLAPTPCCSRTGGYGNVFYLSTNAKDCNVTATWRAHRKGAPVRQPLLHADPPDLHPGVSDEFQSKLTLMSESLRNDGRIWVPKNPTTTRAARPDPRGRARLLPRAEVPGVRQPRAPRRRVPQRQDRGRRGPRRRPAEERRVPRLRRRDRRASASDVVDERYGNLFDMYERITDEDPYKVPMRIYPAVHYTMGGLWVDYNLMSNVPGLFVARRGQLLRPRRQPARRLGADAGPGRRLLRRCRYTIGDYLAGLLGQPPVPTDDPVFAEAEAERRRPDRSGSLSIKRHQVGRPLPPRARQDHVGLLRHGPQQGRPREGPRPRSPRCATSSGRTSGSSATAQR